MESFTTNMPIAGKNLWRAIYRLFYYGFVIQLMSKKTLYRKAFTSNLRDLFYMKIIVTIIPTDFAVNSLLVLFCPFLETENKDKFSLGWWSGNDRYRVTVYLKTTPNLIIDFYEGIFLHVIHVRIIVPCFNLCL